MEICKYEFIGYSGYESVEKKITAKIRENIGENFYFEIAINEAVTNAAKYAIYGIDEAEISIDLIIRDTDVSVIVRSITYPFCAEHYREKLYQLLTDSKIKKLNWGDYTADRDCSRGFWYMLTACDYLIVDNDGNKITLCIRKSPDNVSSLKCPETRINQLVPKFLIRKDGVVL